MSVNLRVDPRVAKTFSDLGVHKTALSKLQTKFSSPLPIQKKILSLNSSGCSVLATSIPNTGKSTAAVLSMLSTPSNPPSSITNLVLVPSPALADQYYDLMNSFGATKHVKCLYRTGSPELDDGQHNQFQRDRQTNTLIGTPHRILDYLTVSPNLIRLDKLKQIVIDELDIFAPEKPSSAAQNSPKSPKETPLETLLTYVMSQSSPLITALSTSTSLFPNFSNLSQLFAKCPHPMFEASEPVPTEWKGEIHTIAGSFPLNSEAAYSREIKRTWQGAGLVVVPPNLSPLKIQDQLANIDAVVTGSAEIAGVHIDNLERVYVLGGHKKEDLDRLKWSMTGAHPKLYLYGDHDYPLGK